MPRPPRLADYRTRRDFAATPEPPPAIPGARSGPLTFMVHKHAARRLHYDLRLELDGVLVCWAVPKGPSLDPTQRRLAVHVEDHPFEYRGFEGVIPPDQYGGGPSQIWDAGTFSPDEGGVTSFDNRERAQAELRRGIEAGKVSVTLRGTKLKGSWALVHTRRETNEWLLLKHRDVAARSAPDVLEQNRSVASGLTIDELRARGEAVTTPGGHSYSPADVEGAIPAPVAFVAPMLATPAPIPERGSTWSYEPKLDGLRAQALMDHGSATIRSRGGHDITAQYPEVAAELARQPAASCLLDGEIVAVAANGRPLFELLQQRMNLQGQERIAAAAREIHVVYFVFDLLHLDGYGLLGAALADRRACLDRVLLPSAHVAPVVTIEAGPDTAFQAAVDAGFEGIIAKRARGRYEPGRRSLSWLKRKALDRDTFTVGGFTAGTGRRASTFGGLLIGRPNEDGRLTYRGRVGGGFSEAELLRFQRELELRRAEGSPFADPTPDDRAATWVRPGLRIVVEYTGITSAGVLRSPVFKGFAGEVAVEVHGPRNSPAAPVSDVAAGLLEQLDRPAHRLTLEGAGWTLPLANLDKELWPASPQWPAISKRDLLRYAILAGAHVLPHLQNRPLTLLRFPNGIDGKRFYQRHWKPELPSFVEHIMIFSEGERRDQPWLLCNNLATLLWLCQAADLEWHASLARIDPGPDAPGVPVSFTGSVTALEASILNYPDFLLFDLDPYVYAGTEAKGGEPQPNRPAFSRTCEVALALKELLDSVGLPSFVKTSGATGVHVYVPVRRKLDYTVIRTAATTICIELAARRPKDVTLEWATERRTGKVFLDANQNARHKSLAAPYSPRAKPGGPVSVPQTWETLGRVFPGDASLLDPRWLAEPDPWGQIMERKCDLEAILGL